MLRYICAFLSYFWSGKTSWHRAVEKWSNHRDPVKDLNHAHMTDEKLDLQNGIYSEWEIQFSVVFTVSCTIFKPVQSFGKVPKCPAEILLSTASSARSATYCCYHGLHSPSITSWLKKKVSLCPPWKYRRPSVSLSGGLNVDWFSQFRVQKVAKFFEN